MPELEDASARRAAALPPADDWRTSDQDEINRRRLRAMEEQPEIVNRDERFPIFSDFEVHSPSGLTYVVEVRDLAARQYGCECVDFRVNGLGTCKHIEAVLEWLERNRPLDLAAARSQGSLRIDLVPDRGARTLRVERGLERLPRGVRRLFERDGCLAAGHLPEVAMESWKATAQPEMRVSREVETWLEGRRREAEAVALRRTYEHNVHIGLWPAQETLLPLLPYQREGMLHLACAERALLADELGLGKTVQAVAACALLRRLGRAERFLVVTPASLHAEWADLISRYTGLSVRAPVGNRQVRLAAYGRETAAVFTLVNYDAMLTDTLEVNERLRPDVVMLDEAQRIKNWNTKTALAVKRLRSRYAWVLTGTPVENRIDELYSLVSFLDPTILGPLFRFNREFYDFDERGRPRGYRNLERLRERIRPLLLRRRKRDVATQLPSRVERSFFVPLSESQRRAYAAHEGAVTRLVSVGRRRPLTEGGRERLLRELNMLRMICDSPYILGSGERTCPKLDELGRLLLECMANPEVKVLVFSEWERMIELVSGLCGRFRLNFATHTGSLTATQRQQEIARFRTDPTCRVLLSTDTGGSGLNLRHASVVINCDQPWNPARLEQRVARAWQEDQTHAVTVLNLVSEGTIEQRMLETLARKQLLSDGLLDGRTGSNAGRARGGQDPLAQRLELLLPVAAEPVEPGSRLAPPVPSGRAARRPLEGLAPSDPPREFTQAAAALMESVLISVEERFPARGEASVLMMIVAADADGWRERLRPLMQGLGPGKDGESGPAIRLEVADRAAAGFLRRLEEAGIINASLRASRVLFPFSAAGELAPLTAPERQRARQARDQHARKLRAARVLAAEEMTEESRESVRAAILELGRALAIEHRLPEPGHVRGAVAAPLEAFWPGGAGLLAVVRTFLADEHAPVQPVIAALGQPDETGDKGAHDFFAGIKAKLAGIGG